MTGNDHNSHPATVMHRLVQNVKDFAGLHIHTLLHGC